MDRSAKVFPALGLLAAIGLAAAVFLHRRALDRDLAALRGSIAGVENGLEEIREDLKAVRRKMSADQAAATDRLGEALARLSTIEEAVAGGAGETFADVPPPAPLGPVRKIPGALEGEKLKVLESTGVVEQQNLDRALFSMGAHLWWREAKPGDRLTVEFEAPEEGDHWIIANLTMAGDYGIHQLYVNGEKAGGPVDLFYTVVYPRAPLDLGRFRLKKGANRLTVEIVGANEESNPKYYMFGLDALILRRADAAPAPGPGEKDDPRGAFD